MLSCHCLEGLVKKRIVLLLDGTWNDADVGFSDTNIVRLRENLASSLDSSPTAPHLTTGSVPNQASIIARNHNGIPYLIFYERGVGTGGFFDNIKGGAFGAGVGRHVRRAYSFLSRNYEPGDEIFVFGFSRGSYTARSLVGYISAVGLLRASNCTEENESRGWYYYRTNPLDRLPVTAAELRRNAHRQDEVKIKLLGVFDTVGALGVPIPWFRRENRDLFEFHDVGLSPICEVNIQALAIDEHREAFEATLWRKPKFENIKTKTEQVWFAGAHSDVGGGYVDERDSAAGSTLRLDDITLDWMIKRLLSHYSDFPVRKLSVGEGFSLAPHHESRRTIFSARPFAYRSIANCSGNARGPWQIDVSADRHNPAIDEMLHISAILRLGGRIPRPKRQRLYAPRNLIAALKRIETGLIPALPIVEFSGRILPPQDAMPIIAAARAKLESLKLWPS
jgi:uncharacterized protein (DUF2235 family)